MLPCEMRITKTQ